MNNKQWNSLWINASVATLEHAKDEYGIITNAAIGIKNGIIDWIGKQSELQGTIEHLADTVHDVRGKWITPGLIDCHTHLVFAGNRANEFEMRLEGESYEMIAGKGGGIKSTVLATRNVSEEELYQESAVRLQALLKEGVTTIEIKSGYGLDLETEVKILKVADKLAKNFPVRIIKTYLGAHTCPSEYKDNPDAYIDFICETVIPYVAKNKLADCVDVYCEKIAFNLIQTEKVFLTAQKFNLKIKCHSEQLSNIGASALAARFNALSVDHLEYLAESDIALLEKSKTVAVLLPGAYYYLQEKKAPPVDLLRKHKIPIAIATDCNPGTSPTTSLLLMLNMACVLFKLTPAEALKGVTSSAALALGLENQIGTLTVGKEADFVVWDISHPRDLAYFIGINKCTQVIKGGEIRQL